MLCNWVGSRLRPSSNPLMISLTSTCGQLQVFNRSLVNCLPWCQNLHILKILMFASLLHHLCSQVKTQRSMERHSRWCLPAQKTSVAAKWGEDLAARYEEIVFWCFQVLRPVRRSCSSCWAPCKKGLSLAKCFARSCGLCNKSFCERHGSV